jgi:membrane-bound lytic murein transglycosylase MltF
VQKSILNRRCRFFTIFTILFLFVSTSNLTRAQDETINQAIKPWTGDFEDMLEKRQIRALVVYNKILYFLDGVRQRGSSYDALEQFREFIDKKYDLGARKLNIIYIPVTREKLIPYLNEGIGDIAVANITITPERSAEVDFSDPFISGVKEILVTGPTAPQISGLEDLAGEEIYVRKSSSYYVHLEKMNQIFADNGLEPMKLVAADEYLEDGDLLEMVNAGLLPMIIVDSHKAKFWSGVFENITARDDIAITVEGSIGWAFRKDSPTFEKVINQFVAENKKGTLIGNTLLKRYLVNNKWAKNALDEESQRRYQSMAKYFQDYGGQYNFDWFMLLALGYQESGLDQSVESAAGAKGVMQLLQSTAEDPNVGIPNIHELESNIHAGAKYLRFILDRYFADSGADTLNQTLLTFASYNAGPAKINRMREEAKNRGLDPNIWFGNLEHVVAEKIGRETVQYVSNIYKYYIAYKILFEKHGMKEEAKAALTEELE